MKETRKQIVEQTRNDVARQYNAQISRLQERIDDLAEDYNTERRKRIECQEKVDELQEKVNQYEDWIRRLQEFMDMPDNQREQYMVHIQEKEKSERVLSGLCDLMKKTGMFDLYNLI